MTAVHGTIVTFPGARITVTDMRFIRARVGWCVARAVQCVACADQRKEPETDYAAKPVEHYCVLDWLAYPRSGRGFVMLVGKV